MKFLNSTNVMTAATLALAIITFFYLQETSQIRNISETALDISKEALELDSEPKIFIENISSEVKPNYTNNTLQVSAIVKIKNAGKTEGLQFEAPYTLRSGNSSIKGKIGPLPYLFTTQRVEYKTKVMIVKISKENMEIVRQSVELKKSLIVPKDLAPVITLDIYLNYKDRHGKEHSVPYSWKYVFHKNIWILSGVPEDE